MAPVGDRHLQLAVVEEVRSPEPPIRLDASFFEPGPAAAVAGQLAIWEERVVAVAAPANESPERACDAALAARGVAPSRPSAEASALYGALGGAPFAPADDANEGAVPEGAYHTAPVLETNADGIFCALGGRRLPARRHPLGVQMRIEELAAEEVVDGGGDLWHRRIEELDAVAAALCAHRYAVGHACWVGDPAQGVIVLPGAALPPQFAAEGVLPPVERLPLPEA